MSSTLHLPRARRAALRWAMAAIAIVSTASAEPALAQDTAKPAPPPAKVYAALPAIAQARLSPDGVRLAGITAAKGRRAFAIWELEGNAPPRVIPTGSGEPQWVHWKSPTRLLASVRVVSQRGPLTRTFDTRLVSVDVRSGAIVELVRGYNGDWEPQIQDRVLSFLPDDPDHVLLELPTIDRASGASPSASTIRERMEHPEAVRVDLRDGSTRTVVRSHGQINHWIASRDGEVRLGWAYQRDKSVQLLRRERADALWRPVLALPLNQGQRFEPLAFVDDASDRVYALSNLDGEHDAIVEYDLAAQRAVRVLADGEKGDATPLLHNGALIGVDRSGQRPLWLQPDWATADALLAQPLRGAGYRLVDRSQDGQRTLVSVRRGNEPVSYYLLSRENGKPVLEPVGETQPGLPVDQIAPTREVSYTARDGLKIPALLTLPRGHRPADGALPFVVLPHGGPTAHDSRGWDYWVQFLISRGYGVLQPQFRGSTGYGRAFQVAGFAQWGLAMQDDVTDGTRWLIEQKLADPRRIALVGASYGGYAALMGVAKEPGLYRSAIAIAAATDLQRLIDDRRESLFGDLNLPQIGDRDQVLRTSPLRLVDRIAVPVLLVHGRQDFTVPVEHTEEMAAALKKAGRRVDTLLLADADHYFQAEPDRLALLTAIEQFLDTHLR